MASLIIGKSLLSFGGVFAVISPVHLDSDCLSFVPCLLHHDFETGHYQINAKINYIT